MHKERSVSELANAAQQLLRISPELSYLIQDQQDLASQITAHQLFKINQEQRRIYIAYPFFDIQFFTPQPAAEYAADSLVRSNFDYQHHKSEQLEDFFLQDIHFHY